MKADWAGCEPSCNNCGQVCPTGAIRALPLAEKKAARMGLAVVNERTCLPHAGREACQLCVDECDAAGYHAIEFVGAGTKADENGNPIGSGFKTPEQGAATTVWAATSPQLAGIGGVYCEDCDVAEPTDDPNILRGVRSWAIDSDEAARLWALSSTLTGVDALVG